MKYELHHHTLFSLNDGEGSAEDTRDFCEKKNIAAIAVTDHGHVMAHDAFKKAFAVSNTKVIYGCEAYIATRPANDTDEDDDDDVIAHLVLLAKDYEGLKVLYRLVTSGYENMIGNKPVISQEQLRHYCAPGTQGHGHIIAMSACMQGVLCVESLFNRRLGKKAAKMLRKADRLGLDMDAYNDVVQQVNDLTEQLSALKERRAALSVLKGKKYTARLKQVEKLKGSSTYEVELVKVKAEMAETERAAEAFATVKEQESTLSKQLTAIKGSAKNFEGKVARYNEITEAANALLEKQIPEEQLYSNARAAAIEYREIFGDDFYVELQYHGIPEETICFPMVAAVAEELGIKVVATNDSHVLEPTEENFKARQILRSLRFNKWEEEMQGDRELYVKSDEELASMLRQILPGETVDAAIANTAYIANQCNVVFPEETHYPKYPAEDPLQLLKDLTNEGFKKLSFKNKEERAVYLERARYEMKIIEQLGVVDYLLIVQDFLEYGRLLGKIDTNDPRFLADPYNIELLKELGKGNVGMSVGIGRGSAVGSLVCYLIGITGADPIKYNLLFERFLNPERVTMPKKIGHSM